MDSTYKTGLIRKLDGLTTLERSGYGIPRVQVAYRAFPWVAIGWAAVSIVVAIGLNLLLDSGCELTGVITNAGKACI